jgi:hypothetical protein
MRFKASIIQWKLVISIIFNRNLWIFNAHKCYTVHYMCKIFINKNQMNKFKIDWYFKFEPFLQNMSFIQKFISHWYDILQHSRTSAGLALGHKGHRPLASKIQIQKASEIQ